VRCLVEAVDSLAPSNESSSEAARTHALQRLLEELEPLATQDHPDRLRRRIDALDRLELHLLGDDRGPTAGADAAALAMERRAHVLQATLEAMNQVSYRSLRSDIRRGRPQAMLRQVQACGTDIDNAIAEGEGYDHLDELVGGVLRWRLPGPPRAAPEDGMVFYQPTPVRHVFDLVERAAPGAGDVVVDLGSGLGHVVLLVAISTAARCIGIEREAAYVDSARRSAAALRVRNASFIQCDARTADFSTGTLFYFYTPFVGDVMRTVLDSLRVQAAERDIRIAAFGPCTAVIAAEPWLEPAGKTEPGRVALFVPRR
jgi:hypothetical protein